MSLVDIVTFARHRASYKFQTSGVGFADAGSSSLAVVSITVALDAANWQEIGGTFSATTLSFPLVIPTIAGGAVGGGVSLAGIWAGFAFFFYNPGVGQMPPPSYTDPFGHMYAVVGVPVGGTASGTLGNLAGAMSMDGFAGSVVGTEIVLVALAPGSLWDNRPLQGGGENSVSAGPTCGGGLTYQSNSEFVYNGKLAGNAAYIQLTVQTDPGHQNCVVLTAVPQNVSGAGSPLVYKLAIGYWMVIANDFSVYLFALQPQGPPDLNIGNNTFWASTPMIIPTGQPSPDAAAFVSVGVFQEGPYAAYMWIDSTYLTGGWGQQGLSMETYRLPSTAGELLTLAGQSLLTPAIVAMGTTANVSTAWIGLMADAFIDSHYSAPYAVATLANVVGGALQTTYRAISAQNSSQNTIHTLWVASGEGGIADPGNGGTGGAGGVGSGPGDTPATNPPDNNIIVTPGNVGIAVQSGHKAQTHVTISSNSPVPIPISVGIIGPGWINIISISGSSVAVGLSVDLIIQADATLEGPQQNGAILTVYPVGYANLPVNITVLVFNGTTAIGGTGKSGIVNTDLDNVIWASGDKFTNLMVGLPIVIAGFAFIVTGFTDPEHIQVAPNPVNQMNVPYYT